MTSLGNCGFRQASECGCTTRCAVQPQTTPAPVPRFTVRDQLMVCMFVGLVAGVFTFVISARAEPYFKLEALKCQEACHVVSR